MIVVSGDAMMTRKRIGGSDNLTWPCSGNNEIFLKFNHITMKNINVETNLLFLFVMLTIGTAKSLTAVIVFP